MNETREIEIDGELFYFEKGKLIRFGSEKKRKVTVSDVLVASKTNLEKCPVTRGVMIEKKQKR